MAAKAKTDLEAANAAAALKTTSETTTTGATGSSSTAATTGTKKNADGIDEVIESSVVKAKTGPAEGTAIGCDKNLCCGYAYRNLTAEKDSAIIDDVTKKAGDLEVMQICYSKTEIKYTYDSKEYNFSCLEAAVRTAV